MCIRRLFRSGWPPYSLASLCSSLVVGHFLRSWASCSWTMASAQSRSCSPRACHSSSNWAFDDEWHAPGEQERDCADAIVHEQEAHDLRKCPTTSDEHKEAKEYGGQPDRNLSLIHISEPTRPY